MLKGAKVRDVDEEDYHWLYRIFVFLVGCRQMYLIEVHCSEGYCYKMDCFLQVLNMLDPERED